MSDKSTKMTQADAARIQSSNVPIPLVPPYLFLISSPGTITQLELILNVGHGR